MNIKAAKRRKIKRTLARLYTADFPRESFRSPASVRQRPVLLIGPPGMGKTAHIMKQIARERKLSVWLHIPADPPYPSECDRYPVLKEKTYNGRTYSITEYTMSEIVATAMIVLEATGYTSGILFIDEMNCVSETLAPSCCKLLQNKTFGNHPDTGGLADRGSRKPSGVAYLRSVQGIRYGYRSTA